MKKYSYDFNKINDKFYQIYGNINDYMVRNKNGIENINHYDFEYRYFKDNKLIKVRGICKNLNHLKEKIEKEINQ